MKALVADAINEKGIENLKEVCEVVVDTNHWGIRCNSHKKQNQIAC